MKVTGKVLRCEYCSFLQRLGRDPNNDFYRTKIVPTIPCENCGKASRAVMSTITTEGERRLGLLDDGAGE
jgi:hypothetical protein